MDSLALQKRNIALEHLYNAMKLYKSGDGEGYSILLLAGAAEEILGKLLKNPEERYDKNSGRNNSDALEERVRIEKELGDLLLETSQSESQIREQIVAPKNFVKHFSKVEEPLIEPMRKARQWLLDAIDQLELLDEELPLEIEDFQDLLRGEDSKEIMELNERILSSKGQSGD